MWTPQVPILRAALMSLSMLSTEQEFSPAWLFVQRNTRKPEALCITLPQRWQRAEVRYSSTRTTGHFRARERIRAFRGTEPLAPCPSVAFPKDTTRWREYSSFFNYLFDRPLVRRKETCSSPSAIKEAKWVRALCWARKRANLCFVANRKAIPPS